ncbi:MAG: DUF3276 family protein [Crocinitomicaceae bacterium]|nr:DUF3276 family protein [Crocinitomicaceae bacterium]
MGEGNNYRDDVFSTSVRAGKRTYFFDVKATRGNDLFMTITESKRAGMDENGHLNFEKHKIFLYKEDFDKFIAGLKDAIDHIKHLQESGEYRSMENERRPYQSEDATQPIKEESKGDGGSEVKGSANEVSFDDL